MKKWWDPAYAKVCRILAKPADRSHRETFLNMAEAWETVVRRLQKKTR
jgi:hypothetical protein